MFSKLHIDGFTLKVIAIVGMTTNHVAHAFFYALPFWLLFALYAFGGLTYCIMAYLVVEGYLHTSNIRRYATRLGIFALVAQIPFSLLFGMLGNVLITLLVGLGILWAYDHIKSRPLFVLVLILGCAITFKCDWAIIGPLIVFLFYYLRNRGRRGIAITMAVPYATMIVPALLRLPAEISHGLSKGANALAAGVDDLYMIVEFAGIPLLLNGQSLTDICSLGYAFIGFTLAMILLMNYNGQRGRPMKWFFYAYYPLHLLVIWAAKMLI